MEAAPANWSSTVRRAFSCRHSSRTFWPPRSNTCSTIRTSRDGWVRRAKHGSEASSPRRQWWTRRSSFTPGPWRRGEDPLCHEYVPHARAPWVRSLRVATGGAVAGVRPHRRCRQHSRLPLAAELREGRPRRSASDVDDELRRRARALWIDGAARVVSPRRAARHDVARKRRPRLPFRTSVQPVHVARSEEHTSELQSPYDLVCRLLLDTKKTTIIETWTPRAGRST